MKKNKTIAVLITCHSRKDKTLACLAALFQCDLPKDYAFDVFLVDDGSTDGTSAAVQNLYPKVNVILGNGNLFWNRGMYTAWQEAAKKEYDFFLWLNDDTILFKNSLSLLLQAAFETNNKSILVGTTCSLAEKKITYGGFDKNENLLIPNNKLQVCHFFNGNCVLIPRVVFLMVGFLDPFFQHGFGDFDYGLRAKKMGINSYICNDYIGYCEDNKIYKWANPELKFSERLKSFKSELGPQPYQYFVFSFRHEGFIKALLTTISIFLRLFFPNLWVKN